MRLNLTTALAIALSVCLSPAYAEPANNAPADKAALQAQLDAARTDLQRSARRFEELSRQLRESEGDQIVFQRRTTRKPMLGVLLATDPQAGVRIAGVTPDSPAAKAGLRSGDRLIEIDGRQVLGSSDELRVANARRLLDHLDVKTPVKLKVKRGTQNLAFKATPSLRDDLPAFVFVGPNGDMITGSGDVLIQSDAHGISAHDPSIDPPGVAPQIRKEIFRLGPGDLCKGKDCDELPLLAEAFRWHGLNLAAVDRQLGRYFGTNSGVLVLSTGQSLPGLQPGDVLRTIDGMPVTTPRQAMAALEAHPAGSRVDVEYLRDRRSAHAQVTVPKARPFRFPAPPAPPAAPPAPPAPAAPRAPAAPPPPPAPPARQAIVIDGDAPMLALLPPEPLAPIPPLPADDITPEN